MACKSLYLFGDIDNDANDASAQSATNLHGISVVQVCTAMRIVLHVRKVRTCELHFLKALVDLRRYFSLFSEDKFVPVLLCGYFKHSSDMVTFVT